MLVTTSILAVFFSSFFVAIGAVISPGPISTAIVSQAPRRGWTVGPLVAAGHSLMELLVIVLIALGTGTVLQNAAIRIVIALLGGGLLLWMGGSMFWDVVRGKVSLPGRSPVSETLSYRRFVSLGMLATVSNPFWYAWWVTVAPNLVGQAQQALGAAAVVAFYVGHITADFAWDTLLSTVVGGGRRWLTNGLYRALILVCAGFFVYLGASFVLQGLRMFS